MSGRGGTALAACLLSSLAVAARAVDRSAPPKPGPARPLRLPPMIKLTLSNGLPVRLVELHEVPTVEVLVALRTGAASDPLDRAGLAATTAAMLDEGAGGRDTLALADALDYLGAELSAAAGWDSTTVSLHVPVARLEPALTLLADVVQRPAFPAPELERLRKEALTKLLESRDEPREIAAVALAQALYPADHRYSLASAGDARTLQAIRLEDVQRFHADHYRPGNAVVAVVGDVTPSVQRLLEKSFGSWARGGSSPPPLPAAPQVKGRALWIVDKPGAAQSVVRMGRLGPSRSTPDYHRIQVMNTLLGDSFTSRLNDNLREVHGYAYGASSRFGYRRSPGPFIAAADVQTKSTAPALFELMKELTAIRKPATREEVERARNYLALGYPADFETTVQIARQLASQFVYQLSDDDFAIFVPKVIAVGVDEVERVATEQIDPDNLAIVIVGDRSVIEEPIRALGLGSVTAKSVADVLGLPPRLD